MSLQTVEMNEIGKKWGWILAIGILMVILGTIGIGATFALTLTTVTFFGFLILIGGAFNSSMPSGLKAGHSSGRYLLLCFMSLLVSSW